MATKIIMPSSGQTSNEALVTYWYKTVGDAVQLGDPLFSIETDKATLDIESCGEGVLLAIYHQVDDIVGAGELMAYVGKAGEALPTGGIAMQTSIAAAPPQSAQPASSANNIVSNTVLASPAARKLARENGLPLSAVAGAGMQQPLKKKDIEAELERLSTGSKDDFYCIEMTPMRRAIAQKMLQSVTIAPQYHVTMAIDMGRTKALRDQLNSFLAPEGIKVSYHDIIMKCAAKAIEKHPLINSRLEGSTIKVHREVHFGLAVSVDNGLLVPVVRNAGNKTIAEIARCNTSNIARARAGRLQQDDITGGTITLTNLGMFGVSSFTAIINQPESCILAVGGIHDVPVVRQGAITVSSMMNITATFDHRVIDGAAGAAFLGTVKMLLENPELLLA
jgi:pyruvate dehydrogenase E2 component (dihydrolipoamide acetyltransferase)